MARNPKPERKWYKLVYGCTKAEHKRYSKLEWKRTTNWIFHYCGNISREEFILDIYTLEISSESACLNANQHYKMGVNI